VLKVMQGMQEKMQYGMQEGVQEGVPEGMQEGMPYGRRGHFFHWAHTICRDCVICRRHVTGWQQTVCRDQIVCRADVSIAWCPNVCGCYLEATHELFLRAWKSDDIQHCGNTWQPLFSYTLQAACPTCALNMAAGVALTTSLTLIQPAKP